MWGKNPQPYLQEISDKLLPGKGGGEQMGTSSAREHTIDRMSMLSCFSICNTSE